MKNFYHLTIYYIARLFAAFGSRLSYSRSQRTGKVLGRIAYHVLGKERKKTVSHIMKAFEDTLTVSEAEQLGRLCFEHLGMCLFEVFQFSGILGPQMDKYVTSEGLENLENARKHNKGVIMITGHIGNWELLGAFLARCNIPFTVIARENSNPHLNKLLEHYRALAGFKTIFREEISTVKNTLKLLRNGELIGILVDQHTRVDSLKVPFFGKPAHTPVGPLTLARKTSAPIIFTTIHRLPSGQHRAIFSGPLELQKTDDKTGDLYENAKLINRLYEETIRRYPEQWVWMHRRWRN